jgi:hypothetical protein
MNTTEQKTSTATHAPLRYDASMAQVADDEVETIEELKKTLLKIEEKTFEDGGTAIRSVHAKSHGIVQGQLTVLDHLPPELAQGIFARPRSYPVVMRLSTSPGDMLPDDVSTPRGVAMKIIGVEGKRLPGSEADTTQEFLMVNGPAFLAPDAKHFVRSLKMLAATTDRAEGLKQVLSAALRGTESLLEKAGHPSGTLKGLGGHPLTHILGERFFTQVPVRYGDYVAKLSLVPVSPALLALKDLELPLKDDPDGLRAAVSDFFRDNSADWELRVQLCTDLESMPIEDASVEWPEERSPFVTVARLSAPVQISWDDATSPNADKRLSFSPWHGVEAHRPLGSVMRARRATYEASANFRMAKNGCPFRGAMVDKIADPDSPV